jgi:alpha-tubulin suppressor-like RCC1 family protein
MSKGDLIETGDPLSGGVGTRYNSGAGIQNLTASVEGADLSVDVPMTNITFQYNASAASGSAPAFAYANNKAATGEWHTCAILDNGDLKCWGSDSWGALGTNDTYNYDLAAPQSTAIDLGTGRTAVAVSAGYRNTCAILDNGDLKCWGSGAYGTLGTGGTNYNQDLAAPQSTPIDLGTGRTAVAVSAGYYHTCAILENGDMKCWGYDN